MSLDINAMRTLLDSIGKRMTDEDDKTALAAARGLLAELDALRAVNAKLHASLERYDAAAYEDLLAERDKLRAEAERVKPVLEAAEEMARPYRTLRREQLAKRERDLIEALDAYSTCPVCGPGGCAGHTKAVERG